MLAKCHKIVCHYHHIGMAMTRIHALQKKKHLYEYDSIMSCSTRWDSDFAMVDRLFALKKSVSSDIITNDNCENLSAAE